MNFNAYPTVNMAAATATATAAPSQNPVSFNMHACLTSTVPLYEIVSVSFFQLIYKSIHEAN